MIKRIVLFSLSLLLIFTGKTSGQNSTVCRLGFTYEISQSVNWGNGKPVITGIYPYSSAEQVGLKLHDIIETIDGMPVSDIKNEDIPGLLNPAGKNEVTLTVSNLETGSKEVVVKKECKRRDAMTEDQLATAFAMYSLETTSERLFVCPFKTTTTNDSIDFIMYKTFGFTPIDENNRKLEEKINGYIEKEFRKKGLAYAATEPDMLIQTFYYLNKNPNYTGPNKVVVNKQPVYRYDATLNKMEKFPFLNNTAAEAEAQYLLQLGFRVIDQKFRPGRILWECEANEMLESAFRLENYAQIHIPLMCMQYPYAKYSRNVQYRVSHKVYNYTGISYDINRLELVSGVDPNSPAYAAGIRARDVIEKIDNHSLNRSAEEYTAAYKQFITNTMPYRDGKTVFTDTNGFAYCMYWDKFKYTQVADVLQNPKSMAPFSYLYKFASYVNPSGTNTCTFQVKRGKEKSEIVIRPTVHTEVMVEIK